MKIHKDEIKKNRSFKPRQYQILKEGVWKNIAYRKALELLKTGDYKSIELYDNDTNYKANGLFYSPQTEIKEFTRDKFQDLELGLNKLMNKYKK